MKCRNREMAERVLLYHELPEDERSLVEVHLAECAECAEIFGQLDSVLEGLRQWGGKLRAQSDHPEARRIVEFALAPGRIEPAARQEILRHLEDECPSCQRLYWQVLGTRTGEDEPRRFLPPWLRLPQGLRTARLAALALAVAAVAVTTVVLRRAPVAAPLAARPAAIPEPARAGGEAALARMEDENRQRTREAEALRREVRRIEALPYDAAAVLMLAASRGGDDLPTAEIGARSQLLVLKASLSADMPKFRLYKMVVENAARNRVRTATAPNTSGDFTCLLTRNQFRAGSYSLDIYGLDGGKEQLLAQFPFRTVEQPGAVQAGPQEDRAHP